MIKKILLAQWDSACKNINQCFLKVFLMLWEYEVFRGKGMLSNEKIAMKCWLNKWSSEDRKPFKKCIDLFFKQISRTSVWALLETMQACRIGAGNLLANKAEKRW